MDGVSTSGREVRALRASRVGSRMGAKWGMEEEGEKGRRMGNVLRRWVFVVEVGGG